MHALLVRITLRDDVAEDLMQELFLKLSRSNSLARAVDPVGYAIRAAMRLAFDWRRSQRRRRDTATIVGEPALEYEPEIDRLERREDLQAVLDAIARLPADSRDIVVMRYLEGLSYDQIAVRSAKRPIRPELCATKQSFDCEV